MTLPGFSAETSSYRSNTQYHSIRVSSQVGGGAVAQLFCRIDDSGCWAQLCREAGGLVFYGPENQNPCHIGCIRRFQPAG
jgi:hypothetical protein